MLNLVTILVYNTVQCFVEEAVFFYDFLLKDVNKIKMIIYKNITYINKYFNQVPINLMLAIIYLVLIGSFFMASLEVMVYTKVMSKYS